MIEYSKINCGSQPKACGFALIAHTLLKESIDTLSLSLSTLFNKSLSILGHKLISVAFKLAPAIAGLKFIYINLFTVANLF